MFAAATTAPSNNGLPFGWFDLAFLVFIGFGLVRGRHNGMSKELLPLLQWLAIVFVCGLVHPLLGPVLAGHTGLGKMWSYIIAYVALMVVIMILFSILKHHLANKLAESNFFKDNEYYLGMLAGVLRYLCMVLVALALLNAPVYTQAEIAAHAAYAHETYGGGQGGFSGEFFPTLQQIQEQVLKKSFVGSSLKNQAFINSLFITVKSPAPPSKPKAVMMIGGKPVALPSDNSSAPGPQN